MLIGAAALVPFAVLDAGGALASPVALAACAGIGLLGSALPYGLDQMALRRVSARAFSVLLSLHPAVGAIVGYLLLDQGIDLQTGIAIALVVVASIVAVALRAAAGARLMCGRFTVATDPAVLAERFAGRDARRLDADVQRRADAGRARDHPRARCTSASCASCASGSSRTGRRT